MAKAITSLLSVSTYHEEYRKAQPPRFQRAKPLVHTPPREALSDIEQLNRDIEQLNRDIRRRMASPARGCAQLGGRHGRLGV